MSKCAVIEELEKEQMKRDIPEFRVGDTVRLHTRIIEGEKERTQIFTGTVIARKGCGVSETVSIHRVAYGAGMERVFLIHSPRISKIEVIREGIVRRGKLYYLRGTTGKKSKVKGQMGASKRVTVNQAISKKKSEENVVEAQDAPVQAEEQKSEQQPKEPEKKHENTDESTE